MISDEDKGVLVRRLITEYRLAIVVDHIGLIFEHVFEDTAHRLSSGIIGGLIREIAREHLVRSTPPVHGYVDIP